MRTTKASSPANAAELDVRTRSRLGRVPEWAALLVVLLALGTFFAIRSEFLLRPNNLVNVVTNVAVLGIIAAPGTMLLIAGQVDLSVASCAVFVGMVIANVAPTSLTLAIFAAIGAGLLVGIINAVGVVVLRVNSIITTLATLAAFRGAAKLVSGGQTLILDGFGALGTNRILSVPLSAYMFALVALLYHLVLRYTRFGKHIYAMGGDDRAARLAGIRVSRNIVVGFLLSAVSAILAGLILVSQLGASSPIAAQGLELQVITAVILGGASLNGGRGSMMGTIVAVFIIGLLDNGLNLLSVQSFWQEIILGALLLSAVAFDQFRIRVSQR
ncbi:MAG: ABC transporter permease [bacterium]|nr:ABC transporter permease [bacterium]